MSNPQNSLFCCLVTTVPAADALESLARSCSPRIEVHGDHAVLIDASGLTQAIGAPEDIAREVQRLARAESVDARIALAATTTTAWILAHAREGVTIVAAGKETEALGDVPLRWLTTIPEALGTRHQALTRDTRAMPVPGAQCLVPDLLAILARWGLHTLGDLARLPRADIHARLGPIGVVLHQAACGEPIASFVPAGETVRFVERLELEYAIEGLEPLSFVLARLCESLSASLERADRGAVEVRLRLRLVTRAVHERTLHLPAPLRDARVLRTLILLDLESHLPPAAIDWVEVEAGVVPGAIAQGSLLARALPSAADLATLLARLRALAGESRVGAPALVDTHDARVVAMSAFQVPGFRGSGVPKFAGQRQKSAIRQLQNLGTPEPRNPGTTSVGFRRFRLPIAARVVMHGGAPVRVDLAARGLAGGRVLACAGPWRTSGRWWALDMSGWDRDEWDVELADGGVYRLAKSRATSQWVIEGIVD
jgi:protein ImuB